MSAITDALDRMDFWSRVIIAPLCAHEFGALGAISGSYCIHCGASDDALAAQEERIYRVVAVSQFQAAQEAARLAEL